MPARDNVTGNTCFSAARRLRSATRRVSDGYYDTQAQTAAFKISHRPSSSNHLARLPADKDHSSSSSIKLKKIWLSALILLPRPCSSNSIRKSGLANPLISWIYIISTLRTPAASSNGVCELEECLYRATNTFPSFPFPLSNRHLVRLTVAEEPAPSSLLCLNSISTDSCNRKLALLFLLQCHPTQSQVIQMRSV